MVNLIDLGTDDLYIEQCDQALELQDKWQPKSGDFVFSRRKNIIVVLYYNQEHGEPPRHYTRHETAIWLPREDQLRDMIPLKSHWHKWSDRFFDFADWLQTYDNCFHRSEAAWLAFLMEKLYNKIWDGEEWIIIPKGDEP